MNSKPPSPPAKDFLPADIQTLFAVSRELIRNISNSFHKLRDLAEQIAASAIDNAADLMCRKKLSALGSDTTTRSPPGSHSEQQRLGSLQQAPPKGLSLNLHCLLPSRANRKRMRWWRN